MKDRRKPNPLIQEIVNMVGEEASVGEIKAKFDSLPEELKYAARVAVSMTLGARMVYATGKPVELSPEEGIYFPKGHNP